MDPSSRNEVSLTSVASSNLITGIRKKASTILRRKNYKNVLEINSTCHLSLLSLSSDLPEDCVENHASTIPERSHKVYIIHKKSQQLLS